MYLEFRHIQQKSHLFKKLVFPFAFAFLEGYMYAGMLRNLWLFVFRAGFPKEFM